MEDFKNEMSKLMDSLEELGRNLWNKAEPESAETIRRLRTHVEELKSKLLKSEEDK